MLPRILFFPGTATAVILTLSLHDALPISVAVLLEELQERGANVVGGHSNLLKHEPLIRFKNGSATKPRNHEIRSEEHTSELQSQFHLVCRLLLEKKNTEVNPALLIRKTTT